MAEIIVDEQSLASAKEKVVVIAGGAQGIGAATVKVFYENGAHVYVGDLNQTKGGQLVEQLRSQHSEGQGSVKFMQVNVRDHHSQVALFDTAFQQHGRVDIAVCCAAVPEPMGMWDPEQCNLESIRKDPTPVTDSVDINLNGTLHFTRIALTYLRQNHPADKATTAETIKSPKSITLISSVAGFKEAPGLFAYSSTKHGVMGLMRSLRHLTPPIYNVRINNICPWATDTQMFRGIRDSWEKAQLPLNQPEDVARLIIQVAADDYIHGKAVYVAGGRGFDIEEGINRTEPQWLGEQQAKDLNRGQDVMGLEPNGPNR